MGELAVLGLAAYYLTYIVTQSDFPPMENLRNAVFKRWGVASWQGYLIMCSWCVSAYTSALVVGATTAIDGLARPTAVWLAVAAVSGVASLLVNGLAANKDALLRRDISKPQGKSFIDRVDDAVNEEMVRRGKA